MRTVALRNSGPAARAGGGGRPVKIDIWAADKHMALLFRTDLGPRWDALTRPEQRKRIYSEVVGIFERAKRENGGSLPTVLEAQLLDYHKAFFREFGWSLAAGGKIPR